MKKEEEKKLFELIYPQFQTVVVIPSESPDFLCHIDDEPILGVEVTELFKNEGYARLSKIPGYTLQLIESKAYKHRLDKKFIDVTTVKIKNPDDGFEQEIQGIFDPGMSAREIMECLNTAIRKKCKKGDEYLKLAPEIDLIIHDASEMFSSERQAIFRTLSLFLDRTLLATPFREIFLVITKHSKNVLKLPLKLALFLEEIFIFEKLIREDSVLNKQRRANEKFYVLFYCLEQSGYGNFKVNADDGNITIVAGTYEYTYAATGKNVNWLPFQRCRPDNKYETLSECIADIDSYEVEVGQRFLEERKKISCFVDVFSEIEYNQEDAPDQEPVR